MDAIYFPVRSVCFYRTTRRYAPEDETPLYDTVHTGGRMAPRLVRQWALPGSPICLLRTFTTARLPRLTDISPDDVLNI
jgi:hypothetical protein